MACSAKSSAQSQTRHPAMDIVEVDESGITDRRLTEEDLQELPRNMEYHTPCGNNLKNITQFCGYARKASIIKLKEKHEVDKMNRFSTSGTAVYLALMHHIKECFFNKAISPATRLYLIWKVVFFMRIWRTWLECNELSESDHFITNNAYVYIELNAHMLLNLVYNYATKTFPIECLRVWMPGSQSCEQLFRLLRSMTPTFSTVVNFSMKGILEKIHKLEFISSSESDNSILFH